MSGHLTADEWQRIAEFAQTPKHRRCPEQLLPDEEHKNKSEAPP
jgi:hypothetical protein